MAQNQEFIPGIYNYCDYICEKCVFTGQCYLYWSENDPEAAAEEMEQNLADLEDFIDNEGFDVFPDLNFDEPLADFRPPHMDHQTQEIVGPAYEIIEILDPIMEKLAESTRYPSEMTDALELVLENYLLISVKYYRAVYNMNFNPDAHVSEMEIFRYMDAEKILLAVKAFLWNLRTGLSRLRSFMPGYTASFVKALQLSRDIESRIDQEFLPATRIILSNHSHYFDDEDFH